MTASPAFSDGYYRLTTAAQIMKYSPQMKIYQHLWGRTSPAQ